MFKNVLAIDKPDIFGIVETWFDGNVLEEEHTIDGYDTYRKDRVGRGGGLLLVINNVYKNVRRLDLESVSSNYNEILVCEIRVKIKTWILVLFYRPPSANDNFNTNMGEVLSNIKNAGFRNILLIGDLNMPGINWDTNTSSVYTESNMCNMFDQYNLAQLNHNPSRECNSNVLDVVVANVSFKISDIKCGKSLIKSDHYELNFNIDDLGGGNNNITNKRKVFNFRDVNWDEIEYYVNDLELEDVVSKSKDINEAWTKWKSKLMNVIHSVVPTKLCKNKRGSPWIDGEIIHLSNVKNNLWKKAKQSNRAKDWEEYKRASNNLKNVTKTKYNDFINSACDESSLNPKRFWSVVSTKCKTKKKTVPDTVYYGNEQASDLQSKANLFNKYFYEQFNNTDYDLPAVTSFVNDNLSNLIIDVSEVYEKLIKIDVNKAQGPDGIPTIIYKNLATVLAPSMSMLFNLSIQSGVVPKEWKWANVVPVFKKGPPEDVSNYRPISLLPIIGKILEKCIHNHIYSILLNDISNNQHGFMQQRSTSTQLVSFYDEVYNMADTNIQVDIAYLDFSKAFDCISHKLLLHKLKGLGFSGKLYNWLSEYLTCRMQRVILNGVNSDFLTVKSGVPQGSILGPLLFILFINDIFKAVNDKVTLALYADDSKVSKPINSINDCIVLQNALDKLTSWSKKWGMKFNPKKCEILSTKVSNTYISYDYKISGCVLKRVNKFNDLGVTLSDDLTWNEHIQSCLKKANKRLGLIKRCTGYNCSVKTKLRCYVSLVRPLVEYNTVMWWPSNKKGIIKIESLQRRATKFITNNFNIGYKERLIQCNLLPLTLRRQFLDCVFIYNSINSLNVYNILSSLQYMDDVRINTRLRCNQDKLMFKTVQTKHDLYGKFITRRIVNLWNKIPFDVRNIDLTEMDKNTPFKRELKSWFWNFFVENFLNDNVCTWLVSCNCTTCRLV
jgi:hypothetical protein